MAAASPASPTVDVADALFENACGLTEYAMNPRGSFLVPDVAAAAHSSTDGNRHVTRRTEIFKPSSQHRETPSRVEQNRRSAAAKLAKCSII
jgi:hypothetical protein